MRCGVARFRGQGLPIALCLPSVLSHRSALLFSSTTLRPRNGHSVMSSTEPTGKNVTSLQDEKDLHHSDEKLPGHVEHADIFRDDVLRSNDLMNEAFEGENREHDESIWAAVKSHPMACLWAFIMCFTIVGLTWPFGVSVPLS